MSFILQALQRAEAERARGRSPGLHTPAPVAASAPRRRAGLPWAVAGAATLAAAGVAAWALWPRPQQNVAPALASAPVPAAPVAVAPRLSQPAPPAGTALAPPPVRIVPPLPAVVASAPLHAARGGTAASGSAAAPAAAPPAAAPPAGPAAPVAAPPAPVAPAAVPAPATSRVAPPPAVAAVPTLAELPADLRAALPPLTLGGAIHSPDPAGRLLIVNGQVQREQAPVAPDLVLETIGPRGAVFRFRQQRFQVPY